MSKNVINGYGKKGFSLKNYEVIGFDLDHTLARYRLSHLYKLCYSSIVEHLIQLGYPKNVFREFDENQLQFCQKGLVYDLKRGNFLKLNEHRKLVLVYHGTRRLSNEEVEKLYDGTETETYLKKMPFIRGQIPEDIARNLHCFTDYFTVGTIYLLMEIVDSIDKGEISNKDYAKPFYDFFEGYNKMYRREAFREHSGYFFPNIKENPSAALHKLSEKFLKWLKKLRQDGMTVVVITSSNVDFAETLLKYCIGDNWLSYFDSVVTYARKPGFWTDPDRMFYVIHGHEEGPMVASLKPKTIYAQGSFNRLNKLLKQLTKVDNPKMIYVGDSLTDDMFIPSQSESCDTIGIVEEFESSPSSHWGSFFAVDGQPSFWQHIIASSCSLAVSSVEQLAQISREQIVQSCSSSQIVFN